jgi:hypothetical protein
MPEPMKIDAHNEGNEAVGDPATANGFNHSSKAERDPFAEYLSPEFTERLSRHMRNAVQKAIQDCGD